MGNFILCILGAVAGLVLAGVLFAQQVRQGVDAGAYFVGVGLAFSGLCIWYCAQYWKKNFVK
jgi:hypothetical protein